MSDSELSSLVKELGVKQAEQNGGKYGNGTTEANEDKIKRKRTTSEEDDKEKSEEDSSQEDEDDEEIFSDTDEEIQGSKAKRAKTTVDATNFSFNPLQPDQLEQYLANFNREYKKYR